MENIRTEQLNELDIKITQLNIKKTIEEQKLAELKAKEKKVYSDSQAALKAYEE